MQRNFQESKEALGEVVLLLSASQKRLNRAMKDAPADLCGRCRRASSDLNRAAANVRSTLRDRGEAA